MARRWVSESAGVCEAGASAGAFWVPWPADAIGAVANRAASARAADERNVLVRYIGSLSEPSSGFRRGRACSEARGEVVIRLAPAGGAGEVEQNARDRAG